MENLPDRPYDIRVDERTSTGWSPLLYVEHRNKDRALRDFQWATGDARYGPNGTRKMTLLGPKRELVAESFNGRPVVEGPAL